MAIELFERDKSRRRTINKEGEAELLFWAKGSDDDQAIVDHVLDNAPDEWADLPRQNVHVEPIGPGLWDIVIRCNPNSSEKRTPEPPPVVGDSSYSFDTTGGTQHVSQSLATVAIYPRTGLAVAPDYQGGIGVTDSGVEGTDIVVRQLAYQEEHQIAVATVAGGLVAIIHSLTGTVNNAPFKGFAAGELLFLGASGSRRSTEDFWTITFKFAASRNVTSLAVGPTITVAAKKGWEYLWVGREETEDTGASMLVKRPLAAYVEKVYELADFSALGI